MKKVMISPSRYVQGEGELGNIGEYVKDLGSKALLVASTVDQARVQSYLDSALADGSFELVSSDFKEECTKVEPLLKGVGDGHWVSCHLR